jgi:hypothetical protein
MEEVESLPQPNQEKSWKTLNFTKKLGILTFQKTALSHGFDFCENSGSSTVIVSFFRTFYYGEQLELHLTGIKSIDFSGNESLIDLHLTLRNFSKIPKTHSFYYLLQESSLKAFRFVRCDEIQGNQVDDMSEFLGQQGFFNYSSAVLQPFLETLHQLSSQGELIIRKGRLGLLHELD